MSSQCQCITHRRIPPPPQWDHGARASTVRTKMSLAGAWKQLRWSSDCGQDPGDCSRRTDHQWQKPGSRIRAESVTWYVQANSLTWADMSVAVGYSERSHTAPRVTRSPSTQLFVSVDCTNSSLVTDKLTYCSTAVRLWCLRNALQLNAGLFMSLVIHYLIEDIQDSQGVSTSRNDLYCVGWDVKLYSLTAAQRWRIRACYARRRRPPHISYWRPPSMRLASHLKSYNWLPTAQSMLNFFLFPVVNDRK